MINLIHILWIVITLVRIITWLEFILVTIGKIKIYFIKLIIAESTFFNVMA